MLRVLFDRGNCHAAWTNYDAFPAKITSTINIVCRIPLFPVLFDLSAARQWQYQNMENISAISSIKEDDVEMMYEEYDYYSWLYFDERIPGTARYLTSIWRFLGTRRFKLSIKSNSYIFSRIFHFIHFHPLFEIVLILSFFSIFSKTFKSLTDKSTLHFQLLLVDIINSHNLQFDFIFVNNLTARFGIPVTQIPLINCWRK